MIIVGVNLGVIFLAGAVGLLCYSKKSHLEIYHKLPGTLIIYNNVGKCIPVTDKCIPVTDKCIPVTDKCIPVTDKCIPVTYDKCIPVTDKCILVTDKCIPVTDKCIQYR